MSGPFEYLDMPWTLSVFAFGLLIGGWIATLMYLMFACDSEEHREAHNSLLNLEPVRQIMDSKEKVCVALGFFILLLAVGLTFGAAFSDFEKGPNGLAPESAVMFSISAAFGVGGCYLICEGLGINHH